MTPLPLTIPDHLVLRESRTPQAAAYWRKSAQGWNAMMWQEVLHKVRNLSAHLVRLGLGKGERVAIAVPTSIEWEICHLATLAAGGVIIGIDAHDADNNIRLILRTGLPRLIIVGCPAKHARVLALARETLPTPAMVATLENADSASGQVAIMPLMTEPCDPPEPWPTVREDDLATIIFTSGSTGMPKGLAYTHGQLRLACEAILDRFSDIQPGARFACWLPLSNLFQRIINLCGMIRGGQSYFVDNPADIVTCLPEIKPTLFIGVPRFYEKLYAGIEASVNAKPAWARRGVRWARGVGSQYWHARESGGASLLLRARHAMADRIFLRRIRSLAGDNLQFMVSGSAPLPQWLIEGFGAIGWLVLEAYGTSENVVPIAVNSPQAHRTGSVGRPMPGNELKLADDGELWVRGCGVCREYYGDGDGSTVDADGFLHTGDYARIDSDGFVWLQGRKSEIFKTSTGRRIAPVQTESRIKQIPYVEHAVVLGQGRPVPIALLAINEAGLTAAMPGERSDGARALERIDGDVNNVTRTLPERDQPAGIIVIRSSFTIAGGELTSNLKLRRRRIEEKFGSDIDRLYGELQGNPPNRRIVMEATSLPTS